MQIKTTQIFHITLVRMTKAKIKQQQQQQQNPTKTNAGVAVGKQEQLFMASWSANCYGNYGDHHLYHHLHLHIRNFYSALTFWLYFHYQYQLLCPNLYPSFYRCLQSVFVYIPSNQGSTFSWVPLLLHMSVKLNKSFLCCITGQQAWFCY